MPRLREPSGRGWLAPLIVLGLAAWGGYLAFGAYRFDHDPRRGAIILGCVAAFVGGWFWLLRTRR